MRAPALDARRWLLAVALGVGGGCGDAEEEEPRASVPPPSSTAQAADWSERLAEPTVADLLAALAQPHAQVREALGPHRLHLTTEMSLAPETAAEGPAHPVLDEPVVQPQQVADELTLVWATTEGSGPRLSLSQSNDHERGRDVVVLGDTVYLRQHPRGWFHYPRDSEVIELWLDDAQQAVLDAVQLAAPRLATSTRSLEGSQVEITLDLADDRNPELLASGPTQGWRAAAEITAITGTVVMDTPSGAWLRAKIEVRYRLRGADGKPLSGRLLLDGQVEPGAPGEVSAPADAQPLPQRVRYDDQQRRVLDGLAAP